jgi:hypothetical protein
MRREVVHRESNLLHGIASISVTERLISFCPTLVVDSLFAYSGSLKKSSDFPSPSSLSRARPKAGPAVLKRGF